MDLVSKLAIEYSWLHNYLLQVSAAAKSRRDHRNAIKHHVFENVRKLRPTKKDDIVCIMVARNETLRLPDALRHHRELGVNRFAIIDNLSDDGTREYLLEQPDVDIIATANSYAEARSAVYWFERLSIEYDKGNWFLLVDPDELFIYDGMRHHDLHDLGRLLEKRKAFAMPAPLIDLYSDSDILEVEYEAGQKMVDCCRYFDCTGYLKGVGSKGERWMRGGPRTRLLSTPEEPFKHALMKYPFYRMDRRLQRISIHQISPQPRPNVPVGALLHFKYLSDFASRVHKAIEYGQHYQGGIEYKKYAEGLENHKFKSMMYRGSKKFWGPHSLIEYELMSKIKWPKSIPVRRVVPEGVFY